MFVLTTLHVSDLDRSLSFYQNLIGLPLISRFQAGPSEIAMLGQESGTHLELIAGKVQPETSGSISVGFIPRDLPAVLRTCGGDVQGPISPNPHTVFWFVRDPDGYRVQLLDKN